MANDNQDIRGLISTLTGRLRTIQKPGGSTTSLNQDDDDSHGVRIITLVGNNLGASVRGERTSKHTLGVATPNDDEEDEEDFMTYVNSNFQAINNSIMIGGSYESHDPGVHLDIFDYGDEPNPKTSRKHGLEPVPNQG